jgi:hypothetical protein
MTEQEKEEKIKELYAQKTELLDKYGLFGGGREVNYLHDQINKQLEALGVEE